MPSPPFPATTTSCVSGDPIFLLFGRYGPPSYGLSSDIRADRNTFVLFRKNFVYHHPLPRDIFHLYTTVVFPSPPIGTTCTVRCSLTPIDRLDRKLKSFFSLFVRVDTFLLTVSPFSLLHTLVFSCCLTFPPPYELGISAGRRHFRVSPLGPKSSFQGFFRILLFLIRSKGCELRLTHRLTRTFLRYLI